MTVESSEEKRKTSPMTFKALASATVKLIRQTKIMISAVVFFKGLFGGRFFATSIFPFFLFFVAKSDLLMNGNFGGFFLCDSHSSSRG